MVPIALPKHPPILKIYQFHSQNKLCPIKNTHSVITNLFGIVF